MNPIVTARLKLVPATLAIATAGLHRRDELPALLGATIAPDWPPPLLDAEAMRHLKQELTDNPDPEGWSTWFVLRADARRGSDLLVGICGFISAPREGVVEIGYSVVTSHQNCGLGTEMIAALMHWAFSHPHVNCVFAQTLPELVASQRVLQKNGFIRTESPDPEVLRFELRREAWQRTRS